MPALRGCRPLLLWLAIMGLFAPSALAQSRTVRGKVTDGSAPLPGVSIALKSATKGTSSDTEGNFSIEVPNDQAVLVFSYIGFKRQEVAVGSQQTLAITLAPDVANLDEVVVIGYGTSKRRNVSTAIASVGGENMENRPITSFEQGLQGRAAGVSVSQPSGKPGSGLSIRIRGTSSINASNDPLYVIDGVQVLSTAGLNPNDIEKVDILKDAASSAIYGSRGTNGVVIITTKQGKKGQSQVSFDSYYGFQQVAKKIDMLNADQYKQLITEEYVNAGREVPIDLNAYNNNTNWQNEIFRNSPLQNYQLGVSGGTDKYQYFVSGGWTSEQGAVAPAGFNRSSLRFNQTANVLPKLTLGSTLNLARTNSRDIPDNNRVNNGGAILSALSTPPILGIYKGLGVYQDNPLQGGLDNPVGLTQGPDNRSLNNRINGQVYAEYELPAGLKLKSALSIDSYNNRNDFFVDPISTSQGRATQGQGTATTTEEFVWISDNSLTWNKTFNEKHTFDALLDFTAQQSNYASNYIEGRNFPNGLVKTINAASLIQTANTTKSEWSFLSYIARVNYNYADKYLLSASMRIDGSSRFAPNNKYGYFPGISAAWRIKNEDFLKDVSWVNDLKLRYSFGQTGNAVGFGDFAYLARYGVGSNYPFNEVITPGINTTSIANNDLSWERRTDHNIGIDFTGLDNRLSVTLDIYNKKTTDLLLNVPLPAQTGYTSVTRNTGAMQNRGIELGVSSTNIRSKTVNWTSNLQFTLNRNKILNIGGADILGGGFGDNGAATILREGSPVGSFFGYLSQGVDPQTGNMRYLDVNGDGQINAADRVIMGYFQPKFQAGLNNSVSAFGFDLSALLDASVGGKIYNATRVETEGMAGPGNATTAVLDRWTTPGQITDIPRAVYGDPGEIKNATVNSTRFLENGSYLKLRDVTLGYSFTKLLEKQKVLKSARIYVSGRNLHTFTRYKGFDPEISRSTSPDGLGVDYGTYPIVRSIVFGLSAKF